VLDPFSGSGTTAEATIRHGRRAIGLDLRRSQCTLARRRLLRPHAPVARASRPDKPMPLLDAIGGPV
jgi:site-specific DNA-methyltransferase (adenine-specific)